MIDFGDSPKKNVTRSIAVGELVNEFLEFSRSGAASKLVADASRILQEELTEDKEYLDAIGPMRDLLNTGMDPEDFKEFSELITSGTLMFGVPMIHTLMTLVQYMIAGHFDTLKEIAQQTIAKRLYEHSELDKDTVDAIAVMEMFKHIFTAILTSGLSSSINGNIQPENPAGCYQMGMNIAQKAIKELVDKGEPCDGYFIGMIMGESSNEEED